jgi:hypothetical protein
MVSVPQSQARPLIRIEFEVDGLIGKDFGHLFSRFEFMSMINGGYIIRAQLGDPSINLLSILTKNGYLVSSRSRVLPINFQILASSAGEYPSTATRKQRAIVLSLNSFGGPRDHAYLEFVAIDPPSWYLNAGDASGKSYKGKVSKVIQSIVEEYAPDITLEISETIDNEQNRFWIMRQDPKTFISSLSDWSSSVTRKKTNWILGMNGNKLSIKEQAELLSKSRAFYRFWKGDVDTIKKWDFLADNALSVVQTKLITQGISAISGQYLDRITDKQEQKIFVKDSRTENKKTARTTIKESFKKPDDSPGAGPPRVGWSSVQGIPELYSAGDLGPRYEEYLDGRPRMMWLSLVHNVMRLKLTVLGHGEWSDSMGLGCDTVFLKWRQEPDELGDSLYFHNGVWLVYGFHHIVSRKRWFTDLYLARYDFDSKAEKVG